MTKKVRILLISGLGLLLAVALGIFWACWPLWEPYNLHPDLSGKLSAAHGEAEPHLMLESILRSTDSVLVGTVLEQRTSLDAANGPDSPLAALVRETRQPVVDGRTYTLIQVEKVLAGQELESTLLLIQMAWDGSASSLQEGTRAVLLLTQWNEGYYLPSGPDNVFLLDSNDRLTALSADMLCARYDGLSVRRLAYDIRHSYYGSVIGKSEEEKKAVQRQLAADTSFKIRRLKEWMTLYQENLPEELRWKWEQAESYLQKLTQPDSEEETP